MTEKHCAWSGCKEPNGGRLPADVELPDGCVRRAGELLRDPYCCGDHLRNHLAEGGHLKYENPQLRMFAQWCHTGETCKYLNGWCQDCGRPERPPWPETWMQVAFIMAQRSYDPRLQVGAIIVSADNTQMLSVGYNGNYKGGPHFHESPEPGKSGFIHAEVNALVKCDFNFAKKKHMYVTHMPCKDCSKLIINAEITRVVWKIPYRLTEGVDLLKSVNIEVLSYDEAIEQALAR